MGTPTPPQASRGGGGAYRLENHDELLPGDLVLAPVHLAEQLQDLHLVAVQVGEQGRQGGGPGQLELGHLPAGGSLAFLLKEARERGRGEHSGDTMELGPQIQKQERQRPSHATQTAGRRAKGAGFRQARPALGGLGRLASLSLQVRIRHKRFGQNENQNFMLIPISPVRPVTIIIPLGSQCIKI